MIDNHRYADHVHRYEDRLTDNGWRLVCKCGHTLGMTESR